MQILLRKWSDPSPFLDGAILVISAVEGIQAQTKILMSILKKLRIPTLIFINKIDRMGAKSTRLIENIKEKLIENIIPLYTVEKLGTKEAKIVQKQFNAESDPYFFEESLLALNDDFLLEAYVNERKNHRRTNKSHHDQSNKGR